MVRCRHSSLCASPCRRGRSWGSWFPEASEKALLKGWMEMGPGFVALYWAAGDDDDGLRRVRRVERAKRCGMLA